MSGKDGRDADWHLDTDISGTMASGDNILTPINCVTHNGLRFNYHTRNGSHPGHWFSVYSTWCRGPTLSAVLLSDYGLEVIMVPHCMTSN